MDQRQERITLETERHRISGDLTLPRDGYRSRVSDLLNAAERDFVSLTDAVVEPLDGGEPARHKFMIVARRYIVYAVSADGEL